MGRFHRGQAAQALPAAARGGFSSLGRLSGGGLPTAALAPMRVLRNRNFPRAHRRRRAV